MTTCELKTSTVLTVENISLEFGDWIAPKPTAAIWVSGGAADSDDGDLVVEFEDGRRVTIKNHFQRPTEEDLTEEELAAGVEPKASGMYLPIAVRRVVKAGTTCTGIQAWFS